MPEQNVTTKFKVDISDLKKGIADANKSIKLANAEFKNATAGLDNWSKSADGLTAKIKQQNAVVDAEKTKLDLLKQQLDRLNKSQENGEKIIKDLTAKYENAAKTYGATSDEAKKYAKQLADAQAAQERNSKAADDLKIKIINQDTAVKNAAAQVDKYESALTELRSESSRTASETENLTDKVQRQQKELDELKTKYKNVAAEQGTTSDEARSLAAEISDLSGELKENKSKLNDAEQAANELDKSLEEVGDEANNTTNGGLTAFGVALGNLAANLITAAISKMKDLVTETVNVGKTFDSSMSQVQAVSGATGNDLDRLRDKAKEMGSTTKFTASEAAGAFNYMAMAGWKTEDMINGIDGVLNLAAASGSDLATTSDIVTDALTAMGYSAKDAGRLADVMAAASSNANTNVEMMGHTFQYAAPIVGALGYNMEDTAVAIGLMANAGIKADKAGTALRSILTRLSAPPKECAEAMEELGLSMTDSEGNMKSLDRVMQDLRGAFDGLSETEQTAAAKHLAGAEAMSGLLAIVNAAPEDYNKLTSAVANSGFAIDDVNKSLENSGIQWEKYSDKAWLANGGIEGLADEIIYNVDKIGTSTDDLREYLESEYDMNADDATKAIEAVTAAMENSEGAAQRMANTMLDNLGGDMTLLQSKLEGVQLAIYEKFEPALRNGVEILDKLLDAVQFVVDHSAEFTAALGAMAAGVGAYLAYTTAVTVMTKGWQALTIVTKAQAAAQAALNAVMALNPIGLVVAAIAALVAAFVILWKKSEKFRNFWIGLWKKIKGAAEPIIKALAEWFKNAWDAIKTTWSNTVKFFTDIWDGIKTVFNAVVKFFDDTFTGAWNAIKSIFSTVASWVNDYVFQPIKTYFQPIIEFFKTAFEIIFQLAEGSWKLIKAVWSVVSTWFNDHVIKPVKKFFNDLWTAIKTAASVAWNTIKTIWNVVSNWFNTHIITPVRNFFIAMWDAIKTAASTAWETIKGVWNVVSGWFNNTIVEPVKTFFGGMWDKVKSGASDAWEGIKSVFGSVADWFEEKFSNAWQKVKDVFSTGGEVFEGIKGGIESAFKRVVNAIIRGINKVIAIPFNAINDALDTIRNVEIAGISPFEGLISRFDVPQIPELEQGGILKRGQVGLLEGNGTEAVVPLEKNTGGLRKIAAMIADDMKKTGSIIRGNEGKQTVNNYNFNQTNNSPKALSRFDIYRQTKNLINAAKGV